MFSDARRLASLDAAGVAPALSACANPAWRPGPQPFRENPACQECTDDALAPICVWTGDPAHSFHSIVFLPNRPYYLDH